jgi:uncharacterized membrane protein YhaH (DUF805 family)
VLASPKKTYLILAVTLVASFALSAVGHSGTDAQNDASSVGWIGNIGWIVFMLAILAVLLYTVALGISRLRRRGTA